MDSTIIIPSLRKEEQDILELGRQATMEAYNLKSLEAWRQWTEASKQKRGVWLEWVLKRVK